MESVDGADCHIYKQNGTHACANSETLNGLLKTELNFQGMVLSDYGGESAIALAPTEAYGQLMPTVDLL